MLWAITISILPACKGQWASSIARLKIILMDQERIRSMEKIGICLTIILAIAAWYVPAAKAQEYTLNDLYRRSLKSSEKIKMAEENLLIARYGKHKAWAVLAPRLTAFGTYNHFSEQKVTVAGVLIQPYESGNWGVRADESFSLSFRELNLLNFAGQSITKSEYDLDAAKSDFILAVTVAYFDVLKAKKALEIAAANMERLTQYRDFVAKRVKVGEVTRTSLLRAEGELSGARADYLKATNGFKLARIALVRITGIEDEFRLKEVPLIAPEGLALDQLRSTAREQRPDLKSYDVQKDMASEQVKYAWGAFWPTIGLFAIYNGSDQYPASGSSATQTLNREAVVAGVSVTFPFFEGGLRVAELKEAKAKERQARLAYDDFKKNVDIELQSAYLDWQTQQGILKFLQDQLLFAQDNYNDILRQFENGLAVSLDVMDANALLLTADKNVAEALYNYQLAYLKVQRSSGTLLQFVGIAQ
jgi:outer membrane protein